jgi:hypothetical protein
VRTTAYDIIAREDDRRPPQSWRPTPPTALALRGEELIMNTTAVTISRFPLSSWPGLTARVPDFVALMKSRVMLLAVFTAFVD